MEKCGIQIVGTQVGQPNTFAQYPSGGLTRSTDTQQRKDGQQAHQSNHNDDAHFGSQANVDPFLLHQSIKLVSQALFPVR